MDQEVKFMLAWAFLMLMSVAFFIWGLSGWVTGEIALPVKRSDIIVTGKSAYFVASGHMAFSVGFFSMVVASMLDGGRLKSRKGINLIAGAVAIATLLWVAGIATHYA